MRPPPAHRSPNNRPKWSPVVHTIAEAGESFSGTVFPVKLFNDDTKLDGDLQSPCDNNIDRDFESNISISHGQIDMEPKIGVAASVSGPTSLINDDDEVIPMDLLLSEIQRLVTHDFTGPSKAATYPTVLKPLYQRLQDYHVLLKNARRKLERSATAQPSSSSSSMVGGFIAGSESSSNKLDLTTNAIIASTSTSTTTVAGMTTQLVPSPASTPASSRFSMKYNPDVSNAAVSSASTTMSFLELASQQQQQQQYQQLQDKVLDLEQQLAQSRRAHHTLLQDHILSLKKTSSHFLIGPSATAKLSKADTHAIHGILASVNCGSSSSLPLTNSTTVSSPTNTNNGNSISKTKKKKKDSSLKKDIENSNSVGAINASSQGYSHVDTTNDIFQETIHIAQEIHNRHIRQLKGLPSSIPGDNANVSTTLLSFDSEPCLAAVSSQQLMSEAITRLLRAETELGLLKLVMAQNHEEISGLEEDVFRAQQELKNHRKVFDSLLELHQLGFEAQIREDQLLIKTLEGQIAKTKTEKEETEKLVKRLEFELEEKEKYLNLKRDAYQRQEQELKEGPLKDLEAEIEQLRRDLVTHELKIIEMEQQAKVKDELLEQSQRQLQMNDDNSANDQMLELMERRHKKATVALRATLVKAQRANNRLNKQVSVLTNKMTLVETLNQEYAQQTVRDREQLADLQQQVVDLQIQLDQSNVLASSAITPDTIDQQNNLKAIIAALETQVEELSNSLRLKEEELEQALEETERLALKLEQDLAEQQEIHKAEMHKFAEEKKLQAQRERACQSTSVILFQNMVTKLQNELADTQEKLRDTTLCWGHTKEQLQKCEQSYRRRKKDLEETTKNLHELEETMAKLGDAIGMLETEKMANAILVRTLEERDREIRDMEYRLKVLEETRD
ncbi:hypothetical protein FBU30_007516 [Linnemannia zychae]|nr:hypothetical protein FBU30_007516 [Linnemannia zychae]